MAYIKLPEFEEMDPQIQEKLDLYWKNGKTWRDFQTVSYQKRYI